VKNGEEPGLAYNRVLLTSVPASEARTSDTSLKPTAWWNAEVAAHAVSRSIAASSSTIIS
jgi:NAD(P)H-nitrite reductase large subunit